MSVQQQTVVPGPAIQALIGQRLGPYQSFHPVNPVQIWQWCAAMGERSPLYLNRDYIAHSEFSGHEAVAPPAMMQMWTMRDVDNHYAPGSSSAHPYPLIQALEHEGFTGNVAVSYELGFHRYLVAGDRVHHYKSVVDISALKTTALGVGYFFTDRMEYLDQNGELFAEALITYFQFRPAQVDKQVTTERSVPVQTGNAPVVVEPWQTSYSDIDTAQLSVGDSLPIWQLPITHKLIVAGAIATQDFESAHHNASAARALAMPDIFMNILTSSGLSARYLTDWAGPGSRLRKLKMRLMNPNTPGDTMTLQGKVSALQVEGNDTLATVEFSGVNQLGPHVMGSAVLALAAAKP